MLIAPGRRYRSVNLYYSARTMRLPARVYLKLDPPAALFASAFTHVRRCAGKFIDAAVPRRGNVTGGFLFRAKPPVHAEKTIAARYFLFPFGAARYGRPIRGIYSLNVKIAYGWGEEDPTAAYLVGVSEPEPCSPSIKIAFNVNAKTP